MNHKKPPHKQKIISCQTIEKKVIVLWFLKRNQNHIAEVAELVDALGSGSSGRMPVGVRVSPSALLIIKGLEIFDKFLKTLFWVLVNTLVNTFRNSPDLVNRLPKKRNKKTRQEFSNRV